MQMLEGPWKVQLAGELKGRVLDCIADQNGNHVIQKCLACVHPTSHIAFIVEVSQTFSLLMFVWSC